MFLIFSKIYRSIDMFSHCKMIRQVIEEEKIDSVLS